jgi:3-oxoacyl-[acyl-carrier protein] reductase
MNSANPASPRPLAIVSGGSRGLGYETARGLAARGYDLALIAKDPARLNSAREELIAEYSPTAIWFKHHNAHAADLESQEATRKVAEEISASLPTPQVMVLAHGVMSEKMSKTLRTTDAEWNRVMAINLDSVFTLVNVIAPAMADARNGRD